MWLKYRHNKHKLPLRGCFVLGLFHPEAMPRDEISRPVGTSVTVLGDIGFHLPNRQSRSKQQPTSIATNNIKQQLKSV